MASFTGSGINDNYDGPDAENNTINGRGVQTLCAEVTSLTTSTVETAMIRSTVSTATTF